LEGPCKFRPHYARHDAARKLALPRLGRLSEGGSLLCAVSLVTATAAPAGTLRKPGKRGAKRHGSQLEETLGNGPAKRDLALVALHGVCHSPVPLTLELLLQAGVSQLQGLESDL
jgi:hypothetical protein